MRGARPLLVGLVTAAIGAGCAAPPPIAQLAFLTRVPKRVEPKILARDVEGEFCFSEDVVTVTLRPPWRARLADPGRAVAAALAEVPGANVLTHVQVRTRIEQYLLFQRICSIVVGNAVRIEGSRGSP